MLSILRHRIMALAIGSLNKTILSIINAIAMLPNVSQHNVTFSIPRLSIIELSITTLRIIGAIATMPIDYQHIGRIRDTQNTEIQHNRTYNNTFIF
jgi:hypothetical protein